MSGPFGCPAQTVTATANSTVSGSCINYTTTSSTPAGFPLVGDRQDVGAGSAGNSNSFCFNLTVNLNNFPTSVTLGGLETNHAIYCSGNDGDTRPCNGSPETDETLTFSPPLPGLTFDYWGEATKFGNLINWNTSNLNPKSFQVLRVEHGEDKILTTLQVNSDGFYKFLDDDYHHDFNSYYIKAFNETGNIIYTTNSVFVSNPKAQKVIKTVDILGNTITNPDYRGIKILIYDNGETRKIVTF